MWHFHDSVELLDLVKGVNAWGQATVQAEDVILNHSCEWKVIKKSGEILPDISVSVLSEALIVESINLGNLLALMVSSKDSYSLWESDFKSNHQGDSLNRVESSVNIVTHEDIVVLWDLTANLEELLKIEELTMDISANGDWGSDRLNVALAAEDLLSDLA